MTAVETAPTAVEVGRRRSTWALWGTAAGVCGITANMLAQPSLTEAQRQGGFEEVFGDLSRGAYHLGAVAGFAAVACLLLFAAGFARWAQRQTSDSLALRAVPLALVASAGALIASYGVKGQLAAYLSGGFNEAVYPDQELYLYYLLDDLAGFFSWWGVAVAAGCIAWLSFREPLVVRWVGALAVLAALAPIAPSRRQPGREGAGRSTSWLLMVAHHRCRVDGSRESRGKQELALDLRGWVVVRTAAPDPQIEPRPWRSGCPALTVPADRA